MRSRLAGRLFQGAWLERNRGLRSFRIVDVGKRALKGLSAIQCVWAERPRRKEKFLLISIWLDGATERKKHGWGNDVSQRASRERRWAVLMTNDEGRRANGWWGADY